jgi:hypothetical protein
MTTMNQTDVDNSWDNNGDYNQMDYLESMIKEVRQEKQKLLQKLKDDMMERLCTEQQNRTCPNEQKWEIVDMKEYKSEKNAAFDNYSQRYIPKNLPLFESKIEVGSPTKFVIPLTVSIKIKKGGSAFKATRLIVAMMKVFSDVKPRHTYCKIKLQK